MVIAVPKNTLSAANKAALSKKGYVVIECEEPEKIRVINPEVSFETSDWFMAALESISKNSPSTYQEHFVTNLCKRLKAKENVTPVDNKAAK